MKIKKKGSFKLGLLIAGAFILIVLILAFLLLRVPEKKQMPQLIYNLSCNDNESGMAFVYGDKLYFSGCGETYVFDGESWNKHEPSIAGYSIGYSMKGVEEMDGKTYGFSSEKIYLLNESLQWQEIFNMRLVNVVGRIEDIRAYNGKLYVGTLFNKGINYIFDGNSWSNFSQPCKGQELSSFEIYNGKLYASFDCRNATIYRLEGSSWIPVGYTVFSADHMKTYNGKLFMLVFHGLYYYDGSSINEINTFFEPDKVVGAFHNFLPRFLVYNNRLYAYTTSFSWTNATKKEESGELIAIVYDGNKWDIPVWEKSIININQMVSYKNHLYAVDSFITPKLHILE